MCKEWNEWFKIGKRTKIRTKQWRNTENWKFPPHFTSGDQKKSKEKIINERSYYDYRTVFSSLIKKHKNNINFNYVLILVVSCIIGEQYYDSQYGPFYSISIDCKTMFTINRYTFVLHSRKIMLKQKFYFPDDSIINWTKLWAQSRWNAQNISGPIFLALYKKISTNSTVN